MSRFIAARGSALANQKRIQPPESIAPASSFIWMNITGTVLTATS